MIKRGVSLYSYQQAEFFHQMTWKDELREVATNLNGADGIEIISETTVPQYPMPPESFYFEWNNEMARYGLKAVTYDAFMDTLQFRDHVMTIAECAERLKYDIRIAHRMGFENMRLIKGVPIQAVEIALPLAEELNVRLTSEVHSPQALHAVPGTWGESIGRDIAFIEKTGTKHYGLQPDFGIFQIRPDRPTVAYQLRTTARLPKEESFKVADELLAIYDEIGYKDKELLYAKAEPVAPSLFVKRPNPMGGGLRCPADRLFSGPTADVLELYNVMQYIFCIHGKFYDMTEVEGEPGHYEDKGIQYKEAIAILNACSYDGYINSEFEGQRSQQDMGYEGLVDEVEQVRRHHEMMNRFINDHSKDMTI